MKQLSPRANVAHTILLLSFAVVASLIVGAVYVGLLYRGQPMLGETLLKSKRDFLNTFSLLLMVFVPSVTIYDSLGWGNPWEETAVFRLGRFHRFANKGWFCKLPFLEQAISRDQRPLTLERSNQKLGITSDDFEVTLDSTIHFRVVDTVENIINMRSFPDNLGKLSWTTFTDYIPKLKRVHLLSQSKEVLGYVKESMSRVTQDWGMEIMDIEIKNIQSKTVEPRKERERISALGARASRCTGCLHLKFNKALKRWECKHPEHVQTVDIPEDCHLFDPRMWWEREDPPHYY